MDLLDIAIKLGAAGVLAYVVWSLQNGDLRTKQEILRADAEVTSLKQQLSVAVTSHAEQLREQRADAATRITAIEADNRFLRDALIRALQSTERAAGASERAVSIAEQAIISPQ